MLNGLGYMLFGIPSRDLETTWYDVTQISSVPKPGKSPLLNDRPAPPPTLTQPVSFTL